MNPSSLSGTSLIRSMKSLNEFLISACLDERRRCNASTGSNRSDHSVNRSAAYIRTSVDTLGRFFRLGKSTGMDPDGANLELRLPCPDVMSDDTPPRANFTKRFLSLDELGFASYANMKIRSDLTTAWVTACRTSSSIMSLGDPGRRSILSHDVIARAKWSSRISLSTKELDPVRLRTLGLRTLGGGGTVLRRDE